MQLVIGAWLMMGATLAGAAEATSPFSVQLAALSAAHGGTAQHRLDTQFSGDPVVHCSGVMTIRISSKDHFDTLRHALPVAP